MEPSAARGRPGLIRREARPVSTSRDKAQPGLWASRARRQAGQVRRGFEAWWPVGFILRDGECHRRFGGRSRMKGEEALSSLYLVADAPEALVTRSCNTTAPHARRAAPAFSLPAGTLQPLPPHPVLNPRTRGPAFTSRSTDPPTFAPRARTPARSWGRGGSRRTPGSRPSEPGQKKPPPRASAGGKLRPGCGVKSTSSQHQGTRGGRGLELRPHARALRPVRPSPQLSPPTAPLCPLPSVPTHPPCSPALRPALFPPLPQARPPGLVLPPRAGPAGSRPRGGAESRGEPAGVGALAAQAPSAGPPLGRQRGHI